MECDGIYLARSLAGRDKGLFYVVCGESDGLILLSNGETKPLACPKKKKRKHIQLVNDIPPSVREILCGKELSDLLVKRALRVYEKRLEIE